MKRPRAMHPDLPVVLMTGYAEKALTGNSTGGVGAALHKPFRPQELAARLDALLTAAAEALPVR